MKKIYIFLSSVLFSFAASAQCSDLYFSEYVEGSSNNKALEIYNASGSTIDLSDYAIVRLNGGSTSPDTFNMNGMLSSEGVYIVANSSASAAILALADTTGSATFYNGDDALSIVNVATSTVIDLFGIPGVDPGSSWTWTAGGVSYESRNSTLVRNYSVQSGVTVWDTLEWSTSAIDDISNLGSHSSSCYPPSATEPSAAAADPTAEETDVISMFSNVYTDVIVDTWRTGWSSATLDDVQIGTNDVKKYSALDFVGIETTGANSIDASGMDYFTFDAWTPDATTYRVKLVDFGADNAFGGGDDKEQEIAFESPATGSWTNHKIKLSDFTGLTTTEHISQFIFSAAPAGGATLFVDNVYFSKDPVYTVSDIKDVIMLDADLAPTNEDEIYELTGVVYGVDLDGNEGLSFTIIDATAGMNIHSFVDVSDYVVTEGDEITARGYITFYRGLLELRVDSIKVNSSGNALKDAVVVTTLSEATESDFIKLEKVWLADTTTVWPYGNVSLTNANQDTFTMRIDNSITDVVGTAVMYDTMNITGLGGQFDASAPYNDGYQIFPRGLGDIEEYTASSSVRDFAIEARVYPNPANNNITVIGSEKWNSYEVFSVLGVKVASGELNNNNLSVVGLVEGTYFLQLKSDEKNGVARFIINR